MKTSLKNTTVVVTGGAQGIGYALAKCLVREGARVFSFDVIAPSVFLSGVRYLHVDVTKRSSIRRAVRRLRSPIHIVINNAGVMRRGTLFEATEKEWNLLFSVNVKAQWLMVQETHSLLAKNATLVHVSSRHGVDLAVDPALYALTKAAVITLARIFAKTCPAYRVKIACLGQVDTALHRLGQSKRQLAQQQRRGLLCTPDDAAEKIVQLILSSKSQLLFDEETCRYRLQ